VRFALCAAAALGLGGLALGTAVNDQTCPGDKPGQDESRHLLQRESIGTTTTLGSLAA